MIKFRNKAGEYIAMPEGLGFVEVCDLDGNIACAVYPDSNNFIHIVTHTSKEAKRYSDIFSVKFSPMVEVPATLKN